MAYIYLVIHVLVAATTAVMVRIDSGIPVFDRRTDAVIASSSLGFAVFGCGVVVGLLSPGIVVALFISAANQRSAMILRVAVWDLGTTIVHWVALIPAFQ